MRLRLALCVLISVVGSLAVGCGDDDVVVDPMPPPTEEPEPVADEPTELPDPTPAQAQMHERYDTAEAIRGAFVRGDLEGAKALARSLGPVTGELPEAAASRRGIVPERARALVDTTELEAGARAFANLLEGCGGCHEAAESTWSYETLAMPEGDELPEHMQRHQWASERMFEALVVADPARFDLGARALADAPLTGERGPDEEDPPGLSALAERVHDRAGAAAAAQSMEERAVIYGDVLAACAGCHRHFDDLDRAGVR